MCVFCGWCVKLSVAPPPLVQPWCVSTGLATANPLTLSSPFPRPVSSRLPAPPPHLTDPRSIYSDPFHFLPPPLPVAIRPSRSLFTHTHTHTQAPTFILALLALCPFAERVSFVTEELAKYTNDTGTPIVYVESAAPYTAPITQRPYANAYHQHRKMRSYVPSFAIARRKDCVALPRCHRM